MDKREQLVRAAFRLFYEQGIHAVGINLVLQETGIAKKTLYHHFSGKEALVAAAIRHRDDTYLAWLSQRLGSVPSGESAILELFNALDDWFHDRVPEIDHFRGCFFINASAEYGDRNSAIHQACAEHKAKVAELIRSHVEAMSVSEERVEDLARLIVLLKEGAISVAHVQGNLDAAREAGKSLQGLLGG
ncbi:MAG: TetR/AcrR family transcriptional regulator [Marinobacter sp.]|uniref:TetR/AcrR family transcriptional regulator n=1 Tax=Marinobacter sp. TaxID=50741 RepID=UPI00299E781B|nr:TetR/AcrR family transcriptional regulator [Marinobacter sp.]MDX1755707.1 TetR/AcrR family transcriptional regulator [Marinobacter sp.]